MAKTSSFFCRAHSLLQANLYLTFFLRPHFQLLSGSETNWNTLGERAIDIKDLDNYRTEAIDILFHITLSSTSDETSTVIRNVLHDAFNLSLSREECSNAANEVVKIKSSK